MMTAFPVLSQEPVNTAPRTFLQHAEEELSPHLLAVHNRESALWKVAAVGTLVAFSILMLGAFITSGLYLPISLPLVGIAALVLLEPAKRAYALLIGKSKKASQRAAQWHAIHKHHQALDNSTPRQLQSLLRNKGIHHITGMEVNDPNLTSLKPLIARHLFWENQAAGLNELKEKKLKEAAQLSASNFTENRERVYTLQSEALEHERQALESKVKTAFLNAVIRRPHFKGTLESVGAFSPLSGQERALATQAGLAKKELFTFTDASLQPLRYSEVKRASLPDLALRMAHAIT